MIYFDNAATTSPKPEEVKQAVAYGMAHLSANPGRSGHTLSAAASEAVYRCREALAGFFSFSAPERVVFTQNCTHAVNTVLKGLDLQQGVIVTSSLEHNAVIRPLEICRQKGCRIIKVPVSLTDPEQTARAFEAVIDPSVSLVICTHASNVTGTVLPIARIGAACEAYGVPFAVDAAQSAGVLPIDMESMHIDYLCLPGHKGLYGPMGTGALLCGGELPFTLMQGGTGNFSASVLQPEELPERLESGTLNLPGIVGLKAGVDFIRRRGIGRIHKQEMALIRQAYTGLSRIPGVALYTPYPDDVGYAPVLSFTVNGMPSTETADRLNDMGFALRAGLHCAPDAHRQIGTLDSGTVRIGVSVFNTSAQISQLLWAVKKISQSAK